MAKKTIIANWKMNPGTLAEAKKIFGSVKKTAQKLSHVETVVCPPFVYLHELWKGTSGKKCALGAQDIFWERAGGFTGEVSSSMLSDALVQYVIVGHSERRALGETDDIVNKKIHRAVKDGFKTIVCVGEKERDAHARYFLFLEHEIKQSLAKVTRAVLKNIIIAYEPLWAIGKEAKRPATPHEFFEMLIFIRKILTDMFGKKEAFAVPVLYGGSVDHRNAKEFLAVDGSAGLLVGRASLEPKLFQEILFSADLSAR
ncbi:MAG: triose-phosphate isomerase [Parcubacteria group bacterium]|nr:triose-phosphate isomerase [Parcubacteria group bacterium]